MTSNLKIQPVNPSFGSAASKASGGIRRRLFGFLPNMEIESEKGINAVKKAGETISSAEQRLILGATALMSQPFIDAHNKRVDEETRKVSVARTIAKIIAGTTTGFLIRKGCIKTIDALSKPAVKGASKLKTVFTPEDIIKTDTEEFKQYRNAMGTIVALFVMMFTNFLIDAPLTKFLTNIFVKHQEDKR